MEPARPTVIRAEDGAPPPGPATPGMDRRQLVDHEDRWFGWLRTEPGMAGGWHHHGERDSYIYIIRGAMTIEFGRAGSEQLSASAGDFIVNPRGIVHREVTGPGAETEAFIVRIGHGPLTINVDGPDE
jgi:uncharacterized RmlC-like cupin family protein